MAREWIAGSSEVIPGKFGRTGARSGATAAKFSVTSGRDISVKHIRMHAKCVRIEGSFVVTCAIDAVMRGICEDTSTSIVLSG